MLYLAESKPKLFIPAAFSSILSVFGLLVVSFLMLSATVAKAQVKSTDFYNSGIKAKNDGKLEKALEIWWKAKNELDEPDFRISQAYISHVAEKKIKKYYKKASELYFWGLRGELQDIEKEAFAYELKHISPLLERKQEKALENAFKKEKDDFLSNLESFWSTKDPTPLDEYNERLLEHWERLSYVKRKFRKSTSAEFDDRGRIYIKYGSPFYQKDGRLKYKPGTVSHLLRRRLSPALSRLRRSAGQNATISSKMFNFESRIRTLHDNPFYEVWIYKRLNNESKNTIFLFGSSEKAGGYDKKRALDDFVPGAAFNAEELDPNLKALSNPTDRQALSSDNGGQFGGTEINITPAVIMQIMYYEQLAALDQYFGDSYNRMMDRYLDQSVRLSESDAREFESINAGEMQAVESKAPEQKSQYSDQIFKVPLEVYTYRFIEDGVPQVKLFMEAKASEALYFDQFKTGGNNSNLQKFSILSGYKAYNNSGELINKEVTQKQLKGESDYNSSSEFDFKHEIGKVRVVSSIQVHTQTEDSTLISTNTPYSQALKGVGQEQFSIENSLNLTDFEISDLVWGFGESSSTNSFLPMQIAHDKVLPQSKNIQFYFELYNLDKGDDGLARFSFSYEITKERSGFRLFGKNKKLGLGITLNEQSTTSQHEQLLQIAADRLGPGNYEILIAVEDLVSGDKIKRSNSFQLK